jgi:periplasmic mercuric ion binding protein
MNRNVILRAMTLFMALILTVGVTYAGEKQYKECQIKTSAHCGSCKSTIEKGLNKASGVESSALNLEDKVVTVKYDPSKTDPDKLKDVVASLGYNADIVKAKESCCPGSKIKNSKSCGTNKDCSGKCMGNKTLKTINK